MPLKQDDQSSDPPTLFAKVRRTLADQKAAANFSVGGHIDISSSATDDKKSTFMAPQDFSPNQNNVETTATLGKLLEDCQPASFGLGGKEVYDESYRKALPLDETQFFSNFNPYAVDTVDTSTTGQQRGYRARAHEGGALVVRHNGNEVNFDWSGTDPKAIAWAAFYGDCEHEVLEVRSGHRITLTYNLHMARGVGGLAGMSPFLDATSLPLFKDMRGLLAHKYFLMEGGQITIQCAHFYAHGSGVNIHGLPASLNGADVAVFEVLRKRRLGPQVLPVLSSSGSTKYLVDAAGYYDYSDNDEEDCYYDRYSSESEFSDEELEESDEWSEFGSDDSENERTEEERAAAVARRTKRREKIRLREEAREL
ncbi:uncharacterized protein BDZ99DRAFT_553233 [Mytilinidion resinicola]|uniref:Fe2OG dioxygenase domain-containing protein n=1 Tax=Mytilinidion resinicola TaxID=574789 RepID=A0A6A6Y0U1_9PEZI|nr:uncharacterized protein BDZ99DRAFT_553233 [Mytilinidion resinicola]KAF2801427.1 hypothetical protein BDZ99DRAFT_553233 [Mytilinidion resinicola]